MARSRGRFGGTHTGPLRASKEPHRVGEKAPAAGPAAAARGGLAARAGNLPCPRAAAPRARRRIRRRVHRLHVAIVRTRHELAPACVVRAARLHLLHGLVRRGEAPREAAHPRAGLRLVGADSSGEHRKFEELLGGHPRQGAAD